MTEGGYRDASDGLAEPLEMYDLAFPLQRGLEDVAACAGALAEAGINIDAVRCTSFVAPATCHFLVADGEAARSVLGAAGVVAVTSSPVLVYTLPNRPGTLARYTQSLLAHGVTLDFVYQATAKGVVVGAPDLGAVRRAFAAA